MEKRKRATISYDEIEEDETLVKTPQASEKANHSGIENGVMKFKKARKRHPKFEREEGGYVSPFLNLPAELRNKIYTLALTDEEEDIILFHKSHKGGERVRRRHNTNHGSAHYPYGEQSTSMRSWYPKGHQKHTAVHRLSPSLLAVNRQLNKEGSRFLYQQPLHFDSATTLYHFLPQIGPSNRSILTELVVIHGGDSPKTRYISDTALSPHAFATLADAASLQRFEVTAHRSFVDSQLAGEGSILEVMDPWVRAVGWKRASRILCFTRLAHRQGEYGPEGVEASVKRMELKSKKLIQRLGQFFWEDVRRQAKAKKKAKIQNEG